MTPHFINQHQKLELTKQPTSLNHKLLNYSQKMLLLNKVFYLSVQILVTVAEGEFTNEVINLVKENYDNALASMPHFVMYFVPWWVFYVKLPQQAQKFFSDILKHIIIYENDFSPDLRCPECQNIINVWQEFAEAFNNDSNLSLSIVLAAKKSMQEKRVVSLSEIN